MQASAGSASPKCLLQRLIRSHGLAEPGEIGRQPHERFRTGGHEQLVQVTRNGTRTSRWLDMLDALPLERALLAAFAELVRANSGGPVADIGCGPGQVTAHLHALGSSVFGIDLCSAMVALARQAYPDLRFEQGSMTALDLPDAGLGGILAFYSTIHIQPEQLPLVFAEFERVLAPGGYLLLEFFAGADSQPQEFDHKVVPAYRWSPDSLAELLASAGFVEVDLRYGVRLYRPLDVEQTRRYIDGLRSAPITAVTD
ncbi:class I SAM-dependent methyltransferase [Nocardia sp. CA-290969]|uniref:class I SAM-dependent methyltransferase n=1 Tax=Nocardia sp. CA-290969 TaxID=3239986 RepID=UPI003D8F4B0C